MKVIVNLVKILVVILLIFVLIQNADQRVDLKIFTLYYSQVLLSIVLLFTLLVGVLIGALLVSGSLFTARSEIRELKKKNKQLNAELDNLRNISIDEISEQDISQSSENLE